jgi:hypothetical protein
MAIILAGRFDSTRQVRAVLRDLGAASFGRKEFASYYVNPPGQQGLIPLQGDRLAGPEPVHVRGLTRAAVRPDAAGVEAYLGSLLGALNLPEEGLPEVPVEAGAGPLVAICVDRPGTEQIARATLHRHGAHAIERMEGCWEDGDWKDFDPRAATPALAGQA